MIARQPNFARRAHAGVILLMAAATFCAVNVTYAQVSFEVVHGFSKQTSPGPNALIEASDGNFYGTTYSGGAFGVGTAFKMTPSGIVTILHDFSDSPDGAHPLAALIQATDGNFYGTTSEGGSGCGTIFKMTSAGSVTVLHTFTLGGLANLCLEGGSPDSPLIQASDGNFYGAAAIGGPFFTSEGSAFKITPEGAFTVVHFFAGAGGDGGNPIAAFLQTADGSLYGTTVNGGLFDRGTIFRMAPDGTLTLLHAFTPGEGDFATAVVQGTDGNFYGTLRAGPGGGAVFKVTPAGSLTILHRFTGTNGDGEPSFDSGDLVRAADGNLYGTTAYGGDGQEFIGHGTAFKVLPDGTFSTIYQFTGGVDGAYPSTALVQGRDGNLYGTTGVRNQNGGDEPPGTVFRMTTSGTLTTIRSSFAGFEGFTPEAALIEGPDGNLFGTTAEGGTNYLGTVFRTTPSGVTTTLHAFSGADGAAPRAALLLGPDGNFYGTTAAGGSSNLGTVFRMAPDGAIAVLHAFTSGADGAAPYASLVRGPDGNFYGTTRDGGPLNFGTVFRVTPAGAYAELYQFAGGYDGGHPLAALVLGRDGNFYGTTSITGAFNAGTTFRITPGGSLTILHAFSGTDGTGRDGAYPKAALLQGADGNFYGTTFGGGKSLKGTIFRMTSDGAVSVLHDFADSDGANPAASLIQRADGSLYGTTSVGGGCCSSHGTAFQSTLSGSVTVLHRFIVTCCGDPPFDGTAPHAALLHVRGYLYGTASQGPTPKGGSVFRLHIGGEPTNVHVTVTADRHVQLNWDAVSTATSYTVKRALASGQETVLATGLTTTSFVDTSTTTGQRYYYVVTALNAFGESVASYEVAIMAGRTAEGDFDGDGKADIAVFHPGALPQFPDGPSTWYIRDRVGGNVPFGGGEDIPVARDYDGDGRIDIAIFRPSTGTWHIWQSSTLTFISYTWGGRGDILVPADYDGDGKADIAVFRPSNGTWYIWQSRTQTGITYTWGAVGDVPVPRDYDGDGKTDIAVFRPATGVWYLWQSSTQTASTQTALTYSWGGGVDIPVPADYDGDGKTDIAVFRPAISVWLIWLSSTQTALTYRWGSATDILVPGDYDGDGKTDVAVFRPATGAWYVWQSSTLTSFSTTWGGIGDIPILKRP